MDDGSSPALDNFEDYGIPSSAITFQYFSPVGRTFGQQARLYNHCSQTFGHLHKWIGFMDADEFLEIRDVGRSMKEFLQSYESYGALGINWIVHDSNDLLTRPKSARSGFTRCVIDAPHPDGLEPLNRHIKSFVQTKYYESCASPHNFLLNSSMTTVGENGDEVAWAWREPITRDKILIHHYDVKSREQFQEKISRGNGLDDNRDWSWCEFFHIFLTSSLLTIPREQRGELSEI